MRTLAVELSEIRQSLFKIDRQQMLITEKRITYILQKKKRINNTGRNKIYT